MSLFSAAFSTEVSTLELRIVKAEGLADRGGVFKSPPYVYVDAQLWEERNGIPSVYFTSLGQTEVVSALDPVLDTTYYAEVPPSKLGTICLKLRTFDKKLVGEDELLGEVVVSAEDMNAGPTKVATSDDAAADGLPSATFPLQPMQETHSWTTVEASKSPDAPAAQGHITISWTIHKDALPPIAEAPPGLPDAPAAAEDFQEVQKRFLRASFDRIDKDGSGTLSKAELADVCGALNVHIDVDKVIGSWFRFGSEGNLRDTLTFEQFSSVMLELENTARANLRNLLGSVFYDALTGKTVEVPSGTFCGVDYQFGAFAVSGVATPTSTISIDPQTHIVKFHVSGLKALLKAEGSFTKSSPELSEEATLDVRVSDVQMQVSLWFRVDVNTGKPALTDETVVEAFTIGNIEPTVKGSKPATWLKNMLANLFKVILKKHIVDALKELVKDHLKSNPDVKAQADAIAGGIIWRNQPLRRVTNTFLSVLSPSALSSPISAEEPDPTPAAEPPVPPALPPVSEDAEEAPAGPGIWNGAFGASSPPQESQDKNLVTKLFASTSESDEPQEATRPSLGNLFSGANANDDSAPEAAPRGSTFGQLFSGANANDDSAPEAARRGSTFGQLFSGALGLQEPDQEAK